MTNTQRSVPAVELKVGDTINWEGRLGLIAEVFTAPHYVHFLLAGETWHVVRTTHTVLVTREA